MVNWLHGGCGRAPWAAISWPPAARARGKKTWGCRGQRDARAMPVGKRRPSKDSSIASSAMEEKTREQAWLERAHAVATEQSPQAAPLVRPAHHVPQSGLEVSYRAVQNEPERSVSPPRSPTSRGGGGGAIDYSLASEVPHTLPATLAYPSRRATASRLRGRCGGRRRCTKPCAHTGSLPGRARPIPAAPRSASCVGPTCPLRAASPPRRLTTPTARGLTLTLR
jgi:hypothetical protein